MATTGSALNLANYTTVWSDGFDASSFNWNQWTAFWGNLNDAVFANSSVTLTSYASENWAPIGFMQAPTGPSAGQGYGLYSVTASADAGQGVGICICLWPADNNWPGAELDILESWDASQHAFTTIHWAGADGSNQQDIHQETLDISVPHTYALDWEAGSLTLYIDGVFQFTTTSNVPLDYAHGGINETFGAEVTAAGWDGVSSKVALHVFDMSYAKLNSTATTGTTGTGTGTGTGTTTPTTTPTTTHTPATLSAGTGPDSLVLKLSEDAYNGDAQYTVKVDGVQVGGTFTASALHGSGDDTLTLAGTWGTASHKVTVNFLNDAWGGTATTDRNLYVDAISYNGKAVAIPSGAGNLLATGPVDFSIASTATTTTTTPTTPGTLPSPSNGGLLIQGTAGADQLVGTAGNDVIIGGHGNDGMTGGKGADYFVLAQGDGPDWINDFSAGTDHLLLQGVTPGSVTSTFTSYYGSAGMDVHYGTAGDSVFLAGVWKLGAGDIVFA